MAAATAKARVFGGVRGWKVRVGGSLFRRGHLGRGEGRPRRAPVPLDRCAARLQVGDVEGATKDAEATTRLAPKWAKGWSRLGNCLSRDPTRVSDARRALEKAVRLGSVDARTRSRISTGGTPASATRARGAGWRERFRSLGARVRNPRPTGGSGATPSSPPAPPTTPSPTPSSGSSRRSSVSSRFSSAEPLLGDPDLPFGLGGGRPRRMRAGAFAARDAYDDDPYVSNGTLGGLGTLASLAVLYFAYKNGASPYTLMMIANALGLGGGRRRGMGYGYGGFPGMGYGGMGRRGFGRGFF